MSRVQFIEGNILRSDCEAIVNPVNCVGVMGKGLALAFKQAYPDMFSDYARHCKTVGMIPGDLHAWPTGTLFGTKHVLNVATKMHWREPSHRAYVERGLQMLHHWMGRNKPNSIAIPALGCGLGGLTWGLVKARILYQFEHETEVDVFVYEPHRKV